jgi:hypothetical protein
MCWGSAAWIALVENAKLAAAKIATEAGIETVIISGGGAGLEALARGEDIGTDLAARVADCFSQSAVDPYLRRSGGGFEEYVQDRGTDLAALPLEKLQSFSPKIDGDVTRVLTPEDSIAARDHIGGTAPAQVRAAAARARRRLAG